MKKLLLILAFLNSYIGYAQLSQSEPSLLQLAEALREIPEYDKKKQLEINVLKKELNKVKSTDFHKLFEVYQHLYEAYKLFQYDSSHSYARKLLDVSQQMSEPSLVSLAKLNLGFSLLSSGMYKEALDLLLSTEIATVSNGEKAQYYALVGRCYFDISDYSNDGHYTPEYISRGANYIDSALALWDKNSYEHLYYESLKMLKTRNLAGAKPNLDKILNRSDITAHQVAVTASTLSDYYMKSKARDSAILVLIKAVIADAQSSVKETSASFLLANLLYQKGDIKYASLCINRAVADAMFFGARQRKLQVSAILPLIEAQKFAIVEAQKSRLILYAVLVTFLLALVVGLAIVIYKQIKKLKTTQTALLAAHERTRDFNKRLSQTNEKLNDANKIKEGYIGYFFNVNAAFFNKIERFKKAVDLKIVDRKIDEIRLLVNNINLKKEKEELLKQFDQVFLKLFPNFISEFNELFKEEDRAVLEDDELLNTDLRIFALARMGIHENEKIAHILQYSVNTIYTYKTRIKNKSIVANEEFERRIMAIKTFQ